ncbi:hypothetical protein NESM_000856500 [Novymonas esmeraldas]|uniref:Uncharacterized protein n=1 Tax=Novymonas esmeraldas TaxID=1808958 RepID=A0AAW0F136_9TRYP
MAVQDRSASAKAKGFRAGAPSPAMREPLIMAAAFLDGIVAVSSIPVMKAQSAHVSFSSGAQLAAYQLCFLLPQLLSTLVAEQLTAHISALALLFFTLVCSTGSAALVGFSLSHGAMSMFFAARLANGVFRHDKTLFGVTANTLLMSAGSVGAASRYGMMAGMLLSGVAGDIIGNAVQVAHLFAGVEAVAAALVLIRLIMDSRTVVVTARVSQDYEKWLPNLTRAPAAFFGALSCLVAVSLAAAVNQVMYAVVAPGYGLSYSFTGAHLCFNLVLQTVWMPHIIEAARRVVKDWTPNSLLVGGTEERLAMAAGSALLLGCTLVPYAAEVGPTTFYPVSLLLVDIPAGIVAATAAASVQSAFGKPSGDAPKVARLLGHAAQLVKMMAAPLRICTGEVFAHKKHSVHLVSISLMAYALLYMRTGKVLHAAVGMVAVMVLFTSSAISLEGDL